MIKSKLIYSIPETELAFGIALYQNSKNSFTVQYGKQITKGLSYSQAGEEFGLSVMHALKCENKIED